MNISRSVIFGIAALAFSTSPASARRIVIDGNPFNPVVGCTIGVSCAATPLGFTADFGSGAFNGLYIYGNGLISFGSEIAAGADLSSLASIGTNVFTAGYSPGMTLSNIEVATGLSNVEFVNAPVLRLRYLASFDAQTDIPFQIDIYNVSAGNYVLQFDYGSGIAPADIAADAYIGYNVPGSGALQVNNPRSLVQNAGEDDFRYFFPAGAGGGVPEPLTWSMMLIGFGFVGGSMRSQRRNRERLAAHPIT
jgi:PEP-CTERM motif